MTTIIDRIQRDGIALGGPNRLLPARIDLYRLRRKLADGHALVMIYGSDILGHTASHITRLQEFRMIRRSRRFITTLEYYAVKKGTNGV